MSAVSPPGRALLVTLGLTTALAGCGFGGGGDADPGTPILDLDHRCARFGDVVREFGATLRGRASAHPLGAYFVTGALAMPADDTFGCTRQIFNDLNSQCGASQSPCSRESGSFEGCLLLVEAIFDNGGCSACGDGYCSPNEQKWSFNETLGQWFALCPEDCTCGNGHCEPALNETPGTCSQDCAASCGDGLCEDMEVCGTCADRPFVLPDCERCDADCCQAACGDGVCRDDAGETRASCEQDCSLGICGDGYLMGGENERNCGLDRDAWALHCLDPDCRDGGSCRDERQICGDGVCMGCEMWTCAADCERTGHPVCALGKETCAAGSCGDGVCAATAENMMTCPIDCRPEPTAPCAETPCGMWSAHYCPGACAGTAGTAWCGDGVCNAWETETCADCVTTDSPCVTSGVCAADGLRCEHAELIGAVTGIEVMRDVVVSCSGSCDVVQVCGDVCVQDGASARCVDCSWVKGDGSKAFDGACAIDATPRCQDTTSLSFCQPDPAQPEVVACAKRQVQVCANGCESGACKACTDGNGTCWPGTSCDPASGHCVPDTLCGDGLCGADETGRTGCGFDCDLCGDGWCQAGETNQACAADCACHDACYFINYDRDEFACPEAYAACSCGDHQCAAWEKVGEDWPCPKDCP